MRAASGAPCLCLPLAQAVRRGRRPHEPHLPLHKSLAGHADRVEALVGRNKAALDEADRAITVMTVSGSLQTGFTMGPDALDLLPDARRSVTIVTSGHAPMRSGSAQ